MTENEFDLTRLQHLRRRLVEIGRSALHPDHPAVQPFPCWSVWLTHAGKSVRLPDGLRLNQHGRRLRFQPVCNPLADHQGPPPARPVFPRCPLPLAARENDVPGDTPPRSKAICVQGLDSWCTGMGSRFQHCRPAHPFTDEPCQQPLRETLP